MKASLRELQTEAVADKAWAAFTDTVHRVAKYILSHPQRRHQDCFDENTSEITDLLKQKQEAFNDWLSDKQSTSKHNHLKCLHRPIQPKL